MDDIRKIFTATFLLAVFSVPAITHAALQQYQLSILNPLPGTTTSDAYGINDDGTVVGRGYGGSVFLNKAYVWQSGNVTELPSLGGHAGAVSINNQGLVIGTSTFSSDNFTSQGVIWNSEAIIEIGSLGGVYSVPEGINNYGQVIGASDYRAFTYTQEAGISPLTSLGTFHNALGINDQGHVVGNLSGTVMYYDGTTAHDLGLFPGSCCLYDVWAGANDINNFDQIIGVYSPGIGAKTRSFLWDDGLWSDIGSLGGATFASAINDSGYIVGLSALGVEYNADSHAFIFTKEDGLVDLNDLVIDSAEWSLVHARDINDKGQIVGLAISSTLDRRGFLLTPVPSELDASIVIEPATLNLNSKGNGFSVDMDISDPDNGGIAVTDVNPGVSITSVNGTTIPEGEITENSALTAISGTTVHVVFNDPATGTRQDIIAMVSDAPDNSLVEVCAAGTAQDAGGTTRNFEGCNYIIIKNKGNR